IEIIGFFVLHIKAITEPLTANFTDIVTVFLIVFSIVKSGDSGVRISRRRAVGRDSFSRASVSGNVIIGTIGIEVEVGLAFGVPVSFSAHAIKKNVVTIVKMAIPSTHDLNR